MFVIITISPFHNKVSVVNSKFFVNKVSKINSVICSAAPQNQKDLIIQNLFTVAALIRDIVGINIPKMMDYELIQVRYRNNCA